MKTSKHIFAIVTLALAFLLASSPFTGFSSFTVPTVNAPSTPASVSQADDYGDVMQYDWTQLGKDESHTRFSAGPAPNKPDLLWKRELPASQGGFAAQVGVFNGKAFVLGGNDVYALDAFTGETKWVEPVGGFTPYPGWVPAYPGAPPLYTLLGLTKLDDNYILVDIQTQSRHEIGNNLNGMACLRMDNGSKLWDIITGPWGTPGGELKSYFPARYSTETKMKYVMNYSVTTQIPKVLAYDLSNPSVKPTGPAWEYITDVPGEILCVGGGKVFVSSYQYGIYALDARNGTLLWKARKVGLTGYSATYSDGKLYQASESTRLTCYDAENGTILWDNDQGGRAFFAFGGAHAYGRYYQHNIAVPESFVGCWDAETGDMLWKAEPAYYFIGYLTPAVADGKLYIATSDGGGVAEMEAMPPAFACFDAFSGEKLWELPLSLSQPSIAYGNLYATVGGFFGWGPQTVYCFGSPKPPKPWSMWRGNIDNPGVAMGQSAPENLNVKWMYETDGAVTSSPAVVDGKVYIGSNDQNLYCLDACTGGRMWEFPTEYRITSSPAVVGGQVYLGPDDGNIYCLNAETGAEIWRKDIYAGNIPPILVEISTFQPRSSPIIVSDRLYVGALDGKVYCLNTGNGSTVWTYPTGNAICGSPAYSNGVVYIASTDRNVYALNAATGTHIWNWTTPKQTRQLFLVGTPIVAEGKVFIGGGAAYSAIDWFDPNIIFVALNATTGEEVWNIDLPGNQQSSWSPAYFHNGTDGILYAPRWMSVAAYNAKDGSVLWDQWLGHQVFSSPAYADDPRGGKIYIGADTYSITCLNTTGYPLSVYTAGAPIVSSPAIYDGKLYVGSADGNVYCFDDAPVISTSIWAACDKGATMWSNETVVLCGALCAPVTCISPLDPNVTEVFYPPIPNAEVTVTFSRPNLTMVNVTATTNDEGKFSVSYAPDAVGNWTWMAWWNGADLDSHSYTYAYSDLSSLKVVSPEGEPSEEEGIPAEYIYAIVAVIAIVIIAIVGYAYIRSRKK